MMPQKRKSPYLRAFFTYGADNRIRSKAFLLLFKPLKAFIYRVFTLCTFIVFQKNDATNDATDNNRCVENCPKKKNPERAISLGFIRERNYLPCTSHTLA